jgi:serine/threonine-protein kinase ULK2
MLNPQYGNNDLRKKI